MGKLVCLVMSGWIKIQDQGVPRQIQHSTGWPRTHQLKLRGSNHTQHIVVFGCMDGVLHRSRENFTC